MTTVHHTKTDASLRAAQEEFSDDPERVELITRTRRFKASWLELAEGLTDAKRKGSWSKWGYSTFEEYTKKELHLRPETVDKLTGSFMFLKKSAPNVLRRDGVSESIPSYQAIDFLRRAEEREETPRDVVSEIRQKVFDDSLPFSQVSREYKDTVFPISRAERAEKERAGLKNVAKRLSELLSESRSVPKEIKGDLEKGLGELLSWLEEAEGEQAA